MLLFDTNIFLEILLDQEKSKDCKRLLHDNVGSFNISDFSLHSIGVILFRQNKKNSFFKFVADVLPKVTLLSLPNDGYEALLKPMIHVGLDFDDSYQYAICKYYKKSLVTMDKDFKIIKDIEIQYI
jgi:uncharacterized protein